LIATVHNLIAAVEMHAARPALKIDLKDRLAELIDAAVFPAYSPLPGTAVAGEGVEPPTSGL
jgi:hypothetical protein